MHSILAINKLDKLSTLLDDRTSDLESVNELELKVSNDEQDIESRVRLLGIQLRKLIGKNNERGRLADHRKHIIWLVSHVPEEAVSVSATSGLDPLDETELFNLLDELWRAKIGENDSNFDVIFNASLFFEQAGLYQDALDLAKRAERLKKSSVITRRIRFLKDILNPKGKWKNV